MPDPNDPRARALQSIAQSSRSYGRDRRRGEDASTDPAFQAAIAERDPARRREMLAEYARGRASALFPPTAAGAAPPDRMQMAEDKMAQEAGGMANRMRGAELLQPWQSQPMPGAEDSPETHRMLMGSGREMLEGQGDDRMFADIQQWAPERMAEYQNVPMVGAEDSPEQFAARQAAGKRILAPTYQDQLDARVMRNDDARVESRDEGKPPPGMPPQDGAQAIQDAALGLERRLTARRRR